MTRTPAARGHRHLFVGRPRQLRVAMNRGSAARTALFCHVWVMQATISKCSQLRGCSDWLRLWVVSRTRLRSRLHVWPLHWPAAPVPDQHSACHGYCRADLDVARAGTLPAHLFHRLVLMRARVVVLKICATIYSDHRDLGRLQISVVGGGGSGAGSVFGSGSRAKSFYPECKRRKATEAIERGRQRL